MNKRKKIIFIKPFLILLFMIFICYQTINYLYKNNSITNEEYVKLLLSETYKTKDNNFYNNVMKLFSKNFNPLKVLEINNVNSSTIIDEYNYEKLKVFSSPVKAFNQIDEPLVYIYNTHQLENYMEDSYTYDITPNVMMTSVLLKEILNKLDISSIVLDEEIKDNYFEYSRKHLRNNKMTYPSLKYYIDIHRSSVPKNLSTIKIDGIKYARTLFIIDKSNLKYKDNYNVSLLLSAKLNEKYPGVSRGIRLVEENINQDIDKNVIVIEFGGIENNIEEVMNTIDAFSIVFSKYIGGYDER